MSCAKNYVISELLESVLRNLWKNILHHHCVSVYIWIQTHTVIQRSNGMYVCMYVRMCVYIHTYIHIYVKRDREGKRPSYGLDDRGVRIRAGATNVSPLRYVHTVSGSHHASYPMVNEDFFTGIKRPRPKAGHLLPSSTEIKNYWSSTLLL